MMHHNYSSSSNGAHNRKFALFNEKIANPIFCVEICNAQVVQLWFMAACLKVPPRVGDGLKKLSHYENDSSLRLKLIFEKLRMKKISKNNARMIKYFLQMYFNAF